LPSISWSTSWSCWFQIHIQYSFGNFTFYHFLFSFSYTRPRILLYTFLSIMFNCFLSLFVSVKVSDAYVNVLCIVVFFSINFSYLDMFLFLKKFCSTKCVLLAFFILSCKCVWWLLS
jgi:hypothetical protein